MSCFFTLLTLLMLSSCSCEKSAFESTGENGDGTATATSKMIPSSALADSLADQRELLQRLVNTSAAGRTPLKLPAGRYVISDEIVLPSGLSVEGAGSATVITLTPGSKPGRNVFRIPTRTRNISIRNLTLDANQAGNTGADLVALFVTDNVQNLYFENVTFAGGRDRGVVQIKGLNDYPVGGVKFLGCRFTQAGRTSLEVRGTNDLVVQNCLFENWGMQNPDSPAIQLQSQDCHRVEISRNTFNNRYGKQFAIESAAAYVNNATITENKLNDTGNLGGNGISGYFKQTIISGNVFSGGIGNHRSGLEIFGPRNTLSKNTIPAGSIAISAGRTEDATDVVVSNNTVSTKGANTGGIQAGAGCCRLTNIKITGNSVDTRLSTGNSSGIVVGTYGTRSIVSDITVEANTIYTNAHCIRLEALAGSKNIYLLRNICKEGYSWLGIITDTFQNIQATGNVKELSNQAISYGVKMPPVTEQ